MRTVCLGDRSSTAWLIIVCFTLLEEDAVNSSVNRHGYQTASLKWLGRNTVPWCSPCWLLVSLTQRPPAVPCRGQPPWGRLETCARAVDANAPSKSSQHCPCSGPSSQLSCREMTWAWLHCLLTPYSYPSHSQFLKGLSKAGDIRAALILCLTTTCCWAFRGGGGGGGGLFGRWGLLVV